MKRSLSSKISIIFTVVFFVILMAVVVISGQAAVQQIKDTYYQEQNVELQRLSEEVNKLHKAMDIGATSLVFDEDLNQIMYKLNNEELTTDQRKFYEMLINKRLNTLMYYLPLATNITISNGEKGYIYNVGTYIDSQLSKNNYQKVMASFKEIQYLAPAPSPWFQEDRWVLALYKKFHNPANSNEALVSVEVSYEQVLAQLQESQLLKETNLYLFDTTGELIFPVQTSKNTKALSKISQNKHVSLESDHYYQRTTLGESQWVMLIETSTDSMTKEIWQTRVMIFISIIVLLIMVFGVINLITKRMMSPLEQLVAIVRKESIDFSEENQDEINYLSEMFSSIKLKNLSMEKQLLEGEVREKNAMYQALQAQIKPHFLYNTLNAIGAAGYLYGPEVASQMSQDLANMMRYITSSQTEVTILEEVANCERYLHLIGKIHGDNLEYDVTMEGDFHEIFIPKLTIQPLVENCIKHGLSEQEYPWKIKVLLKHVGHNVSVIVSDNGAGFSEATILEIQNFMKRSQLERLESVVTNGDQGVGLKNIISRLVLMYQDVFTLTIENQPEGAQVELSFNLEEMEQDNENLSSR